MFSVTVDLKAGDRQGRGRTLAEAMATIGPLPARSTLLVRIRWQVGNRSIDATGVTLQEAHEEFIRMATDLLAAVPTTVEVKTDV